MGEVYVFTFGYGLCGKLGHEEHQNEDVPRLVEALVGKKVVGASAGHNHTAAWTDAGEVFTIGNGVRVIWARRAIRKKARRRVCAEAPRPEAGRAPQRLSAY